MHDVQLRSKMLQTVEGRRKFQVRLTAKWNAIEHIEREDVDGMWETFKAGILGRAEEACGRRTCQSGKKRTAWMVKQGS